MSASVLGSVILGYEALWNHWRRRMGVRLLVDTEPGAAGVDAPHLLAALAELWHHAAQPLLLNVHPPALLRELLEQAPQPGIWLEVPNAWLDDALSIGLVRRAHQRGVPLVWRGQPGQAPAESVLAWFHQTLRALSPPQALAALRVSLRQQQNASGGGSFGLPSPVHGGSLYEGLASPALVEHALDRQGIWGVVGWPGEEVLHHYRFQQIQPARHLLLALVQAIDADESMETIEQRLGDEPLLCYRFLRFANSAGLGLQRDVESVRLGLMAMGYARLRAWLMAQLPHASSDPNLDPVRASMVTRARIMERLSGSGVEDDLRREVFLCGIFSQMDLLLSEHLGTAIHRLPLNGRVASAIVGQSGPYAPWLAVASVLESGSSRVIHEVCKAHKMDMADVNRALLRTLAQDGQATRFA